MKIREKIFNVFEINDSDTDLNKSLPEEKHFFEYDSYEFYRKPQNPNQYIPKTQRGFRKAFSEDIIGIEFFIEMATSLRPLVDEAQDIDEIAKLFSMQKLSSRPNLHSVKILRNMIKDPNAEIALYAAEGLNTIENGFIEKIQKIKGKISKKRGKEFILAYILGKLYMEFAKLLEGQHLIQEFYLQESLNSLKKAHNLKNNNSRILKTIGEVCMLQRKYKSAIKIFSFLISKKKDDVISLLRLTECYYLLRDYEKVMKCINIIAGTISKLDDISEQIVYQWILQK